MTVGKVKDFDFSSAGKTVGYCHGGKTKGYAKGGAIVEKATGERYPSRKVMTKHESMETPRMQRDEIVKRETVRAPNLPGNVMLKKGGMTAAKTGNKKGK